MRKHNWKRWIAAMIAAVLVVGCLPSSLQKKVGGQTEVKAETTLSNPRIEEDSSMEAGQKVTWDCIWFGSYPQTEIVDQAETCGTYKKVWAQETDYEVNNALYSELQNASGWDSNGDLIASDGIKYRRIKKSDATYSYSGSSDYYDWKSSDAYHYFRYDKIKWRVLNVSGGKAFLLADKVLDDQKYNTSYTSVTWAISTVRSWLNGYSEGSNAYGTDYSSRNFIGSAFSSADQGAILTTSVVNNNNISYDAAGGDNTSDKIFLLSEAEVYTDAAKGYGFVSESSTYDEARRCKSSTYAKSMGTWSCTSDSYRGNCNWWLRSPGDDAYNAAYVSYYDLVSIDGYDVYMNGIGVRPALNLNLSSSNLWSYAGTVCSDGTVNEVGGGSGTGGDGYDITYDEDAKAYYVEASLYQSNSGTGTIPLEYDETELANDSHIYNHKLGRFTAGLSTLAYNESKNYVESALRQLYYQNIKDVPGKSDGSGSPFWITHKKMLLNGEKTELLLIVVRGTYQIEWVNDFDSGDSGTVHKGFQSATNYVYNESQKYINDSKNGFDKSAKTKIIVTGHSRGAAVSNLLGVKLDNEGFGGVNADPGDIFVYTYATPNVTTDKNNIGKALYSNIFNIVNPEDFVTKVIPPGWGFARYGTTFVLPSRSTDKASDKAVGHVDYSSYLDNIKEKFHSYAPKADGYRPFSNGMTSLCQYVKVISAFVPNVWAYYHKLLAVRLGLAVPSIVPSSSDGTLHYLYRYALGGLLSQNAILEKFAYVVMLKATGGNFGYIGERTMEFFIVHQALKPEFEYAHRSETYLAAMNTLTKTELQVRRKVLNGIANCPVDIQIKDEFGNVIGEIKDNEVVRCDDDIVMGVEGDSKTFYIPEENDFTVEIVGNDTGTMDYSLCEIDPDTGETGRVFYQAVPVEKGLELTQDIESDAGLEDHELKNKFGETLAKKMIDVDQLGSLSVDITVEGNGSANSLSNLTPGDYATVAAVPEEGNVFDGWFDKDDNLITKEAEYSFSITEDVKMKAKFSKGEPSSSNTSTEKKTVKVSKIILTSISKKIARGKKIKLTATVLPKNASNKKLKWSTSNKKLATVTPSGLVTIAKKATPGKTVKITATATDGSSKKQVWAIKVMKGAVKKITVKGYKKTLKAGKTMKLKTKVKVTKGKPVNKKLKWTSLSPKYATVTQTGKVKAKPAGKGKIVKIKVMSTDGTNKSVVKKIKIK